MRLKASLAPTVLILCAALSSLTFHRHAARLLGAPPAVGGDDHSAATGAQWLGAASCSARACHGGVGGMGAAGNEYTTWLRHDPHTRAFAILTDDRSRRMEQLLNGLATQEQAHPENNALCLRCHGPESVPRFGAAFGCESCHGPAQKWIEPHTDPTEWRKLTPQKQRDEFGFQPLRELNDRAHGCVACHVGNAVADVDHDLIAAGHPRLQFEFQTYHANLPRHWREKDERPDFAVRAWLAGQFASAQAALEVLATRAGDLRRPWPEFAEYDCFSCHHDLHTPSRHPARDGPNTRPGAMPRSLWYTGPLLALSGQKQPLADAELATIFNRLDKEMGKPYPNRKSVANDAGAFVQRIAGLDAKVRSLDSANIVRSLLRAELAPLFTTQKGQAVVCNWDSAAQLAMAARAVGGEKHPKLAELFRQLQAPEFDREHFSELWQKARPNK